MCRVGCFIEMVEPDTATFRGMPPARQGRAGRKRKSRLVTIRYRAELRLESLASTGSSSARKTGFSIFLEHPDERALHSRRSPIARMETQPRNHTSGPQFNSCQENRFRTGESAHIRRSSLTTYPRAGPNFPFSVWIFLNRTTPTGAHHWKAFGTAPVVDSGVASGKYARMSFSLFPLTVEVTPGPGGGPKLCGALPRPP